MSLANADRAGVADYVHFQQTAITDVRPPDGPAGLVIVNPPYGTRLGDARKAIAALSLVRPSHEKAFCWLAGWSYHD